VTNLVILCKAQSEEHFSIILQLQVMNVLNLCLLPCK